MVDGKAERRSEKAIHGGKILWGEDVSAIQKLDEEIQKVTEELEEENELIRQENEIRSERIRYETKNHLYDKIARAVREKALAIDAILEEFVKENRASATSDKNVNDDRYVPENVSERLKRAMILGAYVKRMGNMMLITEEADYVSTKELGSAVRESLEYFGMTGMPWDFQEKGEGLMPERLILLSYELFEELLENGEEICSLMVWLDTSESFLFRIMLDAVRVPLDGNWRMEEQKRLGVKLSVECVDETWRVTLRAEGMQQRTGRTDGTQKVSAHVGKEGEA